MNNIIIKPYMETPIVLEGNSRDTVGMVGLSKLLNLDLSNSPLDIKANFFVANNLIAQSDGTRVYKGAGFDINWYSSRKSFGVIETVNVQSKSNLYYATLWHWCVVGGILSAILRGAKLLVVHSALLETARGGLLICGEGNIGKSTTAKRWRASGNICIADDLAMLEYAEDGTIWAYPLPTWSLCRESVSGLSFPINRRVKLTGVLALGRDDNSERITTIDDSIYLAQLYSSAHFPVVSAAKGLPIEEQMTLSKSIKNSVNLLQHKFPHKGLFANLNGDLEATIKLSCIGVKNSE